MAAKNITYPQLLQITWTGERLTARHLDQASATRPIFVLHANGHLATVNSAMMREASITRETEAEGVVKGEDGKPNGELQEPPAMMLAGDSGTKHIKLTRAQKKEARRGPLRQSQ